MGYETKKALGLRPATSDAPKIQTGKPGESTPLGEKNPFKKKESGSQVTD